jgi:uncharacterized protein YciI
MKQEPAPERPDLGLAWLLTFLVIMEPTEAWGDGSVAQRHMRAHLDYLFALQRRGILLASGPVGLTGDPAAGPVAVTWSGRGMAILATRTLEQALEIAGGEPIHRAGLRSNLVQPWHVNEGVITAVLPDLLAAATGPPTDGDEFLLRAIPPGRGQT